MATEKQIEANRANAQKSTGPRSPEGKAASSRNNFRHGLAARGFVVLAGQEDAFEQLELDLRAQLLPANPLQEIIFKRVLECAWNLERCRQAIVRLHAGEPEVDPLIARVNAGHYANIQKYTREHENSLYKAMRELGKLQTEAQFRREQPKFQNEANSGQPPVQTISDLCDYTTVIKTLAKNSQVEARTNNVKIDTELKALAGLPPLEFIRRFEANYVPTPQPELTQAAA